MSRARWAATIGLLTGGIGAVLATIPAVSGLEDSVGLRWLFFARGTLTPPANVAIVSIDDAVAARLDLPPLLRDWPRSTHARLVEHLTERGVSVIAFDVEFRRHGTSPGDDSQFAEAIDSAGRVVLIQRLEVLRSGDQELWVQRDPIPALSEAATGLAIVPVPDSPLVSQFWSFFAGPSSVDLPTLPAVALQVHATPAIPSLLALMERAGVDGLDRLPHSPSDLRSQRDLLRLMQSIRHELTTKPSAVSRMRSLVRTGSDKAAEISDTVGALVEMYSGPHIRHLNFYGPPGTICTVPYDKVIDLESHEDLGCTLRDSIVFVGAARSRLARADQPDTYHTIYESPDGEDFSGVELHATALANLLTRDTLRTPSLPVRLAAVMVIGLCLGAGGFWVRSHRRWFRRTISARLQTAFVLIGLAAVYIVAAHWLFQRFGLLIPFIVPLAIQFPTALLFGLLMRPTSYREQLEAVCLAVDAQGSTALGQRLSHARYARLLSEHTAALSAPLLARGAAVLPPEGDGFVGLWLTRNPAATSRFEAARRVQACRGVIEMMDASRAFHDREPEDVRLPIRIGLSMGTVTVDSDPDRGIFNVVGDAVNVAARIRDLNRDLGTCALASQDVVSGLETTFTLRAVTRDFRLKGVARLPLVFEIVGLVTRKADPHAHSPLSDTVAAGDS